MPVPLLEAKLFVPSRGGVVPRARLRKRLDRSIEVKLTLVAAPAGFGKTTLLANWLADASPAIASVAWLWLEEICWCTCCQLIRSRQPIVVPGVYHQSIDSQGGEPSSVRAHRRHEAACWSSRRLTSDGGALELASRSQKLK